MKPYNGFIKVTSYNKEGVILQRLPMYVKNSFIKPDLVRLNNISFFHNELTIMDVNSARLAVIFSSKNINIVRIAYDEEKVKGHTYNMFGTSLLNPGFGSNDLLDCYTACPFPETLDYMKKMRMIK